MKKVSDEDFGSWRWIILLLYLSNNLLYPSCEVKSKSGIESLELPVEFQENEGYEPKGGDVRIMIDKVQLFLMILIISIDQTR